MISRLTSFFFFFFNDTATTEIYTLSLHDALPISYAKLDVPGLTDDTKLSLIAASVGSWGNKLSVAAIREDRKSTRLNSSHQIISYAVFCLKKKKKEYSE